MSDDKEHVKYIDPEVEKFARENKEMIERILKEERIRAKEVFDAEKDMASELIAYQKQKTIDATEGVVSMFTDPEVQKHFMAVGMELFLGIDALMRAAPIPDFVKDAATKAQDMRDAATSAYCDKNPNCRKQGKPSAEKIQISEASSETKKVDVE